MNTLKALSRIVLTALLLVSFTAPFCGAAVRGGSETRIISQWLRIRGNRTCLFFDVEGPKPTRIGPASDAGISVFFSKMAPGIRDKLFTTTAVKEIQYRRASDFFEVLFRWKNTSVNFGIRNGRYGRYILTIILTPPAVKKPASASSPSAAPKSVDFIGKPGEMAPQVAVGKIHTADLFGSEVSAQMRDDLEKALQAMGAGGASKAQQTTSGATAFVEPDKAGLALYAHANKKFESCSRHLIFCATDVIAAYRRALRAGPESSQAPLALYRSGLAYFLMGRYIDAEKFYKAVTSQWPDDPVACRCWIGLGDLYLKKEAYMEAMAAYQMASLRAKGNKDKAAADYALGKTYLTMGAAKYALGLLQDCLTEQPDFYVTNPRVLRLLGEADFTLGDLDNAQQMLLRYVNLQESDPDQDVLLAKIAEIFLKEGQVDAAKKMYGFVHKYYTNSEGDMICLIRRAELAEKSAPKKAIKMYEALRGMDLSPSLRSIVLAKLAEMEVKKGDLSHGLALMDEAFPLKGNDIPPGIAALRQRVLCDLVRQYYAQKNFKEIVQLVGRYQPVFKAINAPETMEEIALSYAGQKLYSNALDTFDKLIAQEQGVNLDGILLKCSVYALRLKDYKRALGYCQAAQSGALESRKDEILGQIYYRKEQYGEAVSSFGKALKAGGRLDIRDPDSYAAFGDSLYQLKQYGEAIPMIKTALLKATLDNAGRRSMLVMLSDCFKEQKQYAQAAQNLETAVQISTGEQKSEFLYKLSKLYVAAGNTDLAVKSLDRIKASNDTFWSAIAQQELNTMQIAAGIGGKQP
ncbi:MAG: tetratricopeptide repeat protein [Syntrophobacteraceae bacterium]